METQATADQDWGTLGKVQIISVYLLADERIEINWVPQDMEIPEEIEYLSERSDMSVSRTQVQAKMRDDAMHYLFTDEALLRGIRCPLVAWTLYMKSQGKTDADVEAFKERVKNGPKKRIVPAPDEEPAK